MLGSEARKECFWAGDLKVGVVNGPPSLALALLGWEKQMKALVASSAAAILKSCFYCLSFLLSLSLRIMLRPQWTILKALGLPCWRAKMHTTSEKAEGEGEKRPITSFLTMYSKIRQQNDDDQSTVEREKNVGRKKAIKGRQVFPSNFKQGP